MLSEILLRRKNKVNVVPGSSVATNEEKAMVVSIMKNVEAYGYTFSKELMDILLTYSRADIESFYKELIPKIKTLVGADKEYHPMYPNFPKQVMEASDAELYVNAIIHYFTFGQWMPEYEKEERLPLLDSNKMTVLSVGTTDDILDIFKNLVASKTSLSEQDKKDIESIMLDIPDFYKYMPDEIPLKENVALIAKIVAEKVPIKNTHFLNKYFKTATDVLRFITALSDGDISLSVPTKYKSLKRHQRRMVMNLLADCGNILEDMYRYHYQWIRIGELIHPFEFMAPRYNSVYKAFHTLRNEHKPLFIPGKIHEAIIGKDMKTAAKLLKERPGELARQLDKLLRDSNDKNYIINCFNEVAAKVSTPVLLQVRQHFKDRNSNNPIRVFFQKGNLAKAKSIKNELPAIDEKYCKAVVKICNNALVENYKSKDFMGGVYIDDDMMNYVVPFSQRSASASSKTIVRGSKIKLSDDAKVVRAFIWWTNTGEDKYDSRVDIDLSGTIYDENWNYVGHVSYTNLREGKCYHSGDITNGGDVNGKGVAEFLDIDLDYIEDVGRYAVFQIYEYTGHKYSDLPNCRFGWMERKDVNSGEIFEPSTVEMSLDVNAASTVAIPVIFDCKTREFIWCDMNLSAPQTRRHFGGNNLESNLTGTTAVCYAMTHLSKPDLYTLIYLNAVARGYLVDDRNEADIIFSNDTTPPVEIVELENESTHRKTLVERKKEDVKIITPYDIDYFMGELL